MPFLVHAGGRLYYDLLGNPDAPPLVLARGLARSHRYWLGFAELMAEDFRVIIFDNRGVGQSSAPPPPYSTRVMADDVAAVLDAAGIERAHYFGLSLAGMIGQWFAIRHPHRVQSLALGCTTSLGRRGTSWNAKLSILKSARLPLADALRVTAKLTLADDFVRERPDILDVWTTLAREEPASTRGLVGQGCAGLLHDTRGLLPQIQARTLLITGDRDRLIPARNSYQLLEQIPNARLRILPNAGHDFPTERPGETARVLRDFFLTDRENSVGSDENSAWGVLH
jgi:pimeloyl-ACP methyl ester carboxylesterase